MGLPPPWGLLTSATSTVVLVGHDTTSLHPCRVSPPLMGRMRQYLRSPPLGRKAGEAARPPPRTHTRIAPFISSIWLWYSRRSFCSCRNSCFRRSFSSCVQHGAPLPPGWVGAGWVTSRPPCAPPAPTHLHRIHGALEVGRHLLQGGVLFPHRRQRLLPLLRLPLQLRLLLLLRLRQLALHLVQALQRLLAIFPLLVQLPLQPLKLILR